MMDYMVTGAGEYIVHVQSGGCETADTINVAYLELSSISLGQDTILCDGQTLTLHINAPGAQFEWQDLSTSEIFEVSESGTYWVRLSIAACATSDTIVVHYAAPVVVDLGVDTSLCEGETLLLDAQTEPGNYLWQDHSIQSTYMVTEAGVYYVTFDVEGCFGSDTLMVDYIQLPYAILGPDTLLCFGANHLLDASTQGAQYEWQNQTTDPTYLISQPGVYEVTLTIEQCSTSDSIMVEYTAPIHVDLGVDRTICDGEQIILNPLSPQDLEYLWQDNSTASDYEVTEEGLYWVEVRDECSSATDSILVTVEPCACHLFISNVFTPNGDNVNDLLLPQASCGLAEYHLTIYDRYGGLLFESTVAGEGWDGTVKSKNAQSGVYVYTLIYAFETGDTKRIHGDVTLLR